jgi:hypothetical protein
MVEHVAEHERSLAEARSFVVRDVIGAQSETLLQAELARLKQAMPVRKNERALARVTLE